MGNLICTPGYDGTILSSDPLGQRSPPVSSGVFFQWDCEGHPLGDITNGTSANHPFDDVARYNGPVSSGVIGQIVDTVPNGAPHSGTRCIDIGYTGDEDEVHFSLNDLRALIGGTTNSLFCRKYERFGPGWEGAWPRGLKTGRFFTGYDIPQNGFAYLSEKMCWNDTYPSTEQFGRGLNSAIGDLDLVDWYEANQLFGNGLPYLREDHWYKVETWMVLDSGVDANDGILQHWIDDVLVYDNQATPWHESNRGCPEFECLIHGTDWTNMWFGGNYTNSGIFLGGTKHRYIDDLLLSTVNEREVV
ncbi:MAG: hypothetical protein N0E44_18895 [Candidatus Thiodiazotropha lotti]|nr:hypothetical protein [Candidatus Thiodiazotropha lotti]MCW4221953.1 hypothetical protein [Candidatus Thiodiazotropha lotti]